MNNIATSQDMGQTSNTIVVPNKSKILTLPYSEKMQYIDKLRIYYPRLNEILKLVKECHLSTTTSMRPTCMRISGPSGSGKSTVVDMHRKHYPDIETVNGIEKPVLYSRVPCPAYIGGLSSKLLYDLGDPFYNKSKNIILHTQRLYKLLKACKVQIIFLDEVQHLVDRNSQKLLRDSSDWFKELIDETGIPIIFLGMPDSSKIFIENEQLANRVRIVENINVFQYDDTFRKFLHLFDLSLPLKESSNLADPDISRRIYLATNGLMKHIRDLILDSVSIAIKTNSSRISMPMLAQSYNKILFREQDKNPFLPGSE